MSTDALIQNQIENTLLKETSISSLVDPGPRLDPELTLYPWGDSSAVSDSVLN